MTDVVATAAMDAIATCRFGLFLPPASTNEIAIQSREYDAASESGGKIRSSSGARNSATRSNTDASTACILALREEPITRLRKVSDSHLVERGELPDLPAPHLYYIVTGAGATMFVLGPECRRLSGLDPNDPDVIEAHADAVCLLLFGH